jgi:hypothetical protein
MFRDEKSEKSISVFQIDEYVGEYSLYKVQY